MHAPQRAFKLFGHPRKRYAERRATTDQYIVMAVTHRTAAGQPHDFPQAPPHAVSLDRIADLLRDREAAPRRALIGALARLQHESGGREPGSRCRGQKVRPLPQPFHASMRAAGARRQADRRLRPRARRADKTLRPPLVAMRVRKP